MTNESTNFNGSMRDRRTQIRCYRKTINSNPLMQRYSNNTKATGNSSADYAIQNCHLHTSSLGTHSTVRRCRKLRVIPGDETPATVRMPAGRRCTAHCGRIAVGSARRPEHVSCESPTEAATVGRSKSNVIYLKSIFFYKLANSDQFCCSISIQHDIAVWIEMVD